MPSARPLSQTLEVIVSAFYSPEVQARTVALIKKRFHVSDDYALRLAVAALDGIESHGGDPNDLATINETIKVAVASWVKNGALR